MTDHAQRLNTLLRDLFDEYDNSNGPLSKEDVLIALTWATAGVLSSIEPDELRRKHIRICQMAFQVADSDEEDDGSGVLQ